MAEFFKHLLIDASITHPMAPGHVDWFEDWLERLVEAVDMDLLTAPHAVWCDVPGNEGMTGMVGLTTSHASLHEWPTFLKFDLFSCKDFSIEDVLHLFSELTAYEIRYTILTRQTGELAKITDEGILTYESESESWGRKSCASPTPARDSAPTSPPARWPLFVAKLRKLIGL